MDTTNCQEILWGRFGDVRRLFSIPRSTAYALIDAGLIKSRVVRVKGKRGNGIRLIDFNSVRAFIEGAPEQPSKKVRIEMARRAFASADARAKNGGEA